MNLWFKCPTHYKPQPKTTTRGNEVIVGRKRKSLLNDHPPPKKQEVEEDLCRTRLVDDSIRAFSLRLEPNHKGVTGWLGSLAQNGCEMAQRRLAHGCEMALRRLAHHPVFGVFGVW